MGNALIRANLLLVQDGSLGMQEDSTTWDLRLIHRTCEHRSHLAMTDIHAESNPRDAMTENIENDDERHPQGGQETSLFRQAKNSSKDNSKTHKHKRRKDRSNLERGVQLIVDQARQRISAGALNQSRESMNTFLKIDACEICRRAMPWEWVPAILLHGKPLAGTGVWRSLFVDGKCPACVAVLEARQGDEQRARAMRCRLVQLLGGEKPYREFTFERFEIAPGNQLAYERSTNFWICVSGFESHHDFLR
jgi:hypothetical protein